MIKEKTKTHEDTETCRVELLDTVTFAFEAKYGERGEKFNDL